MDTSEITTILENDPYVAPVFGGCLPSEVLCGMGEVSHPCALVCNYDPSHKPGTHWIAIYLTEDGKAEFFDPYGVAPMSDHFSDFLERNSTGWTFNTRQLQGLTTTVCGHYAIFYLIWRTRQWSMEFIVNLFEKDTSRNDQAVYRFVEKLI